MAIYTVWETMGQINDPVFLLGERRKMEKTLEELYGIKKAEVDLTRIQTKSGKWLELFVAPSSVLVDLSFPEFTCLCPRTSQPDFATIGIIYIPKGLCVELKSLKYYLNSFRNEGHFHEEVITIIDQDLREALTPVKLGVIGEFNRRGGIEPVVRAGDDLG